MCRTVNVISSHVQGNLEVNKDISTPNLLSFNFSDSFMYFAKKLHGIERYEEFDIRNSVTMYLKA